MPVGEFGADNIHESGVQNMKERDGTAMERVRRRLWRGRPRGGSRVDGIDGQRTSASGLRNGPESVHRRRRTPLPVGTIPALH
jgi:hypothetical protein